MATKTFCDKCGRELPGTVPAASITPGYVGSKDLCAECWKWWGEIVRDFFREA